MMTPDPPPPKKKPLKVIVIDLHRDGRVTGTLGGKTVEIDPYDPEAVLAFSKAAEAEFED